MNCGLLQDVQLVDFLLKLRNVNTVLNVNIKTKIRLSILY